MKETADPLTFYRIEKPVPGPRVLLTAGVHGDEYEPMLAAAEVIRELPERLLAGCVTVVPVVNPTAYARGRRCGADGLDLARICPGREDGSVSEWAAAQISGLIREADYYIDLHTGGLQLDIFPLAGYMLHASAEILKQQRQLALAFNLPLIWGTESSPDGRTLSVARDAGVPAIYVEFGGGGGIRKEIITAYKEGFYNILKSLGMIEGRPEVPVRPPLWIEDHTPSGGFLQGKMPAPIGGIFRAEVAVGDRVKSDQVWGVITDPVSGESEEIRAGADGLVFLLRKEVKVEAGDALGGIMPFSESGKLVINGR